ncbi:uncharacterized protein VTP21DRAFT_10539 [Calcarisporiella thermophila]|uniref:uncharacterized protein n=1 Tax=Calcarisporiella thermophila TaxID=911321 RepID=UPI003743C174
MLDSYFDAYSDSLGVPADHLRLVVVILATYPLSLLFRCLPNSPLLKHLFSIVTTTYFFVAFFRQYIGFLHILVSSLVTYLIVYARRDKWAPRIVFVFTMGHMAISHIIRQIKGPLGDRELDWTGAQMVLVMKLTSFAFSVADGNQPAEKLEDFQRDKRITRFPNLIEYFGWIFFYGGFHVGPAVEYSDYDNFIHRTIFPPTDPKTGQKRDVSREGTLPALLTLAQSIFFIIVLVTIMPLFPMETMVTDQFLKWPLWYRMIYLQIAGIGARIKYYSVWLMAEGACILCGLGFNGYDKNGKPTWNRVSNIDPLGYETAENVKALLESWNQRTNIWLKNYVYMRVTPPGHKPSFSSTLITFSVSALWHGFHPGYYLTFLSAALAQNIAKKLRRNLRVLFMSPTLKPPHPRIKAVYDLVGRIVTVASFNYIAVPFVLLSLKDSFAVWRAVYFHVHIGMLALEVFFAFGGARWCRKLQKRRTRAEAGVDLKSLPPRDEVEVNETGIPQLESEGAVQAGEVKIE